MLKKRIKANFTHIKSLIGQINGFMSENISGMKIVQIFHCEKLKLAEFISLNEEYNSVTKFQIQLNSLLKPGMEVVQTLAVAVIIWYGMDQLTVYNVELGVIYAFTSYIKQFFSPISELADSYTTIQSALVSAGRIFELLDCEPELENMDAGIRVGKLKGEIEFKNVFFAYQDEDWILQNVSFCIKAGEIAAFVGETGAGKTTIISLLSRFYPVGRGEITIDGINIQEINLRDLRKNIGVVLQDVFLFAGDIKSNIALNNTLTDSDIEQALATSCAAAFVRELPGGLQEAVAENGRMFSAGQRQLLSLARALAHQPTMLVLDEATSNIDTKTEQLLQQSITNIAHRHTMVIIAHRLSTVRRADKIIVMDKGKVVETGSHDELIKRSGYYRELYETQAFAT
jgi:ATP-binding cassette subfamily B protein